MFLSVNLAKWPPPAGGLWEGPNRAGGKVEGAGEMSATTVLATRTKSQ